MYFQFQTTKLKINFWEHNLVIQGLYTFLAQIAEIIEKNGISKTQVNN